MKRLEMTTEERLEKSDMEFKVLQEKLQLLRDIQGLLAESITGIKWLNDNIDK